MKKSLDERRKNSNLRRFSWESTEKKNTFPSLLSMNKRRFLRVFSGTGVSRINLKNLSPITSILPLSSGVSLFSLIKAFKNLSTSAAALNPIFFKSSTESEDSGLFSPVGKNLLK